MNNYYGDMKEWNGTVQLPNIYHHELIMNYFEIRQDMDIINKQGNT